MNGIAFPPPRLPTRTEDGMLLTQWTNGLAARGNAFANPDVETPSGRAVSVYERPTRGMRCTAIMAPRRRLTICGSAGHGSTTTPRSFPRQRLCASVHRGSMATPGAPTGRTSRIEGCRGGRGSMVVSPLSRLRPALRALSEDNRMLTRRSALFALVLVASAASASAQSPRSQQPIFGDGNSGLKQLGGCTTVGKKVIADLHIDLAVSCTEFPVQAGGQDATMVIVSHGPGQDCPAGCIWQVTTDLVIDGKTFDAPNEPSDETIRDFMRQGYGDWCGVPAGETGMYTSYDGGGGGRFMYAAIHGAGASYRRPGHGNEPSIALQQVSDTAYGWRYHFTLYSTEKPLRDGFLAKWHLLSSAEALGQPSACIIDGDPTIMKRDSGSGVIADARKLSVQLVPLQDLTERTVADYVATCRRQGGWKSEVPCVFYLGQFGGFEAVCQMMPET